MKTFSILFASLTVLCAADAAAVRTVPLLDGEITLEVPHGLTEKSTYSKPDSHYDYLIALEAPDRQLSVWATCGRRVMMRAGLQHLLDEKVQWYSTLKTKHRQFQLLDHSLIERQGREWAQIRFTHDTSDPAGGEIYTRCLSGVVNGHLLEVWAATHFARDPGQRAAVDHVIDSVKIAH